MRPVTSEEHRAGFSKPGATPVATAWRTAVKVITTGILAALLVGAAIKLKLLGGTP